MDTECTHPETDRVPWGEDAAGNREYGCGRCGRTPAELAWGRPQRG